MTTMVKGGTELLQDPVAQELLASKIPARLAYNWTDGSPRVVSIWFHWDGTDIVFDIEPTPDGTELRFTHVGIAPGVECYEMCSSAWSVFVGHSLRQLVLTGTGRPGVPEPVQA